MSKPTELVYVPQDSCSQLFVGTRWVGSIGSEPYWHKLSETDEMFARQVVASFNAIQSAAEKLGRDPVELGADLNLFELITRLQESTDLLDRLVGEGVIDSEAPEAAVQVTYNRAALSLLQGK